VRSKAKSALDLHAGVAIPRSVEDHLHNPGELGLNRQVIQRDQTGFSIADLFGETFRWTQIQSRIEAGVQPDHPPAELVGKVGCRKPGQPLVAVGGEELLGPLKQGQALGVERRANLIGVEAPVIVMKPAPGELALKTDEFGAGFLAVLLETVGKDEPQGVVVWLSADGREERVEVVGSVHNAIALALWPND